MKKSQNFPSPRRAMTLIEIMAAILVLSIGLVAVVAAIPFGGMRMEQMQEADSAAAVGRNAIRLIKANDWANPNGWDWANLALLGMVGRPANNPASFLDNGNFNLASPYFIDPLGKMATGDNLFRPEFVAMVPNGGHATTITRVYPRLVPYQNAFQPGFYWNQASAETLTFLRTNSASLCERYFYLQDDVFYGYYDGEDESEFRPGLETEKDNFNGDVPAFSGRYGWMATVSLTQNLAPFNNCPAGDVATADFDVAVFKDRIPGDEKAFKATIQGSGYQGGSVELDLTTGVTGDPTNALDPERVVEQLEKTRCIMLIGREDLPSVASDGSLGYRAFAKWYRIANYAVVDDVAGKPAILRLSLIGPNTPRSWTANNGVTGAAVPVTALFFPGVVGVYSSSTTFTEL